MQSDGKSTFIEGLLGFQFNVVDSNIGTRRPLVIQMVNDPGRRVPCARFRKEAVGGPGEDPFEARDTPVEDLAREIARRTAAVAGAAGDRVSERPIVLRVEYRGCPNLNIYDTPGFRLGGGERLRDDIRRMVLRIAEPRHRVIVCLEQSTVEWANTVSRPLARTVDPALARTILVNTKFDNRIKELTDAQMANKYLSAVDSNNNSNNIANNNQSNSKLNENNNNNNNNPVLNRNTKGIQPKPFFVSLPVERGFSARRPEEFQAAIRECYLEDYRRLLRVGFDEGRYGAQIGFCRARAHLEAVLAERYERAVRPTLCALDGACRKAAADLERVRRELSGASVPELKAAAAEFAQGLAGAVERLLEGSVAGNPDARGQTLAEERASSGAPDWPDFELAAAYDIANAGHRVYGGAQYERLLTEFEYVAHSRELPAASANEIASAIGGVARAHSIPALETAASDIVQHKALAAFRPLIDVLLARAAYVVSRLFDIALAVMCPSTAPQHSALISSSSSSPSSCSSAKTGRAARDWSNLVRFEQFVTQLRGVYESFVAQTVAECRTKLCDDLSTFTRALDWDLVFIDSSRNIPPVQKKGKAKKGGETINNNDKNDKNDSEEEKEGGGGEDANDDVLCVPREATVARVKAIMEGPQVPFQTFFTCARTRRVDDGAAREVLRMSARLFAGIRFLFAKLARAKMNAFFLCPMREALGAALVEHFRALPDAAYEQMFQLSITALKESERKLTAQLERCKASYAKFQAAAEKLAAKK